MTEEELTPHAGLVIRDDLQVIAWEGDTYIEAFLGADQAAFLGARLTHLARAHKAAVKAEQDQQAAEEQAERWKMELPR